MYVYIRRPLEGHQAEGRRSSLVALHPACPSRLFNLTEPCSPAFPAFSALFSL